MSRALVDPTRHPRNSLATTQRILTHALGLFAARGYDGVSLDDVATAAGIKKPTLFYYFESKDALYGAIARLVAERFAALAEHLADARPSRESLEALVSEIHDLLADAPTAAVLLVREAMDRKVEGINAAFEPFLDLAEKYVRAGQRSGVFARELEPRHAIEAVVGSFTLFFLGPTFLTRRDRPTTPEALAAHRASSIAFVRRALLAEPDAASPAPAEKTRRSR